MKTKYNSADELIAELDRVRGKTFGELDSRNLFAKGKKDKGIFGKIVEVDVFHYPNNSRAEADFANLGIELKVCGVVKYKNKNAYKAKERLALNTFNYEKVSRQEFLESDVYHKCNKMLIALYEYLEKVLYQDFKVLKGFISEFDQKDLAIITNDYNILRNKVLNDKADTISETDTFYLTACTSGAGHGKLLNVSVCTKPVKERKFALKNSYMTRLIQEHISPEEIESIVTSAELQSNSLSDIILNRFKPYYGKTEAELRAMFNIDSISKSVLERIVAHMLGAKGKVNDSDEFQKADIEMKIVRVEENGNIEQNMSFPYFQFTDIVDQDWEESDFRELLASKRFLFVVFKKVNGQFVFSHTKFWHIPDKVLDTEGLKTFNELKRILKSGIIVRGFKTDKVGHKIRLNNFPKSKESAFIHIRPHAQDASDTLPLPVADKLTGVTEYTKQCFWLKKGYILSILNDEEDEYICKNLKL